MFTFKQPALYTCCLLFCALIVSTVSAQNEKNNFIIEGRISNMLIPPQKVYLTYDTVADKPMDSSLVREGRYTFRGTIDEPVMVTIRNYDYDTEGRRVRSISTD